MYIYKVFLILRIFVIFTLKRALSKIFQKNSTNIRASSTLNPGTESIEVPAIKTCRRSKIISEDTRKLLNILSALPWEYMCEKTREKMEEITTRISNFTMGVIKKYIKRFRDIENNLIYSATGVFKDETETEGNTSKRTDNKKR